MNDLRTVRRSLRHWTLHVCLSASGSFAMAYQSNWHSVQAVSGMLGGIALFVLLYTWIWSSHWFQRRVAIGGTLDRALLHATRLRSVIGVCGMSCAVLSGSSYALLTPIIKFIAVLLIIPFWLDGLAGALLASAVDSIGKSSFVQALRVIVAGSDPHQRAQSMLVGDINSFLPTFLLTIAQGVLLSLILLALAWWCEIILLYRARRKRVTHLDTATSPL